MGTVSRYSPVITIRAMVKIGPWTVEEVSHGPSRKCDRCGTLHNYVWVCTIDPTVSNAIVADRLEGRRTWRVGSTCGPTLEMVSAETWTGDTKELQKRIKLAVDAARVLADCDRAGYADLYVDTVREWQQPLINGTLSQHYQRVMGSHVRSIAKSLRRRAQKEAEQRLR